MKMLKIAALPNGAHDNQDFHGVLPEGWALIKEDVTTLKNFPFGEVKAELLSFGEPDPETGEIPQMMTMTEWAPGEIPETEEEDAPEDGDSIWDELDAAYQEGVNNAYDS